VRLDGFVQTLRQKIVIFLKIEATKERFFSEKRFYFLEKNEKCF
jgi:hypothetical protein